MPPAVAAQSPLIHRPESDKSSGAAPIPRVNPEGDAAYAEGLEGVAHQEQLRGGVRPAAPPRPAEEGASNLGAPMLGAELVEPSRPDGRTSRRLGHDEGHRVRILKPRREESGEVLDGFGPRCRHARPELGIDEREELLGVQGCQRRQADAMPSKGHGVMHADIEAPPPDSRNGDRGYVDMNFG